MESDVKQFGFTPYIGEGFISPNRKLVTDVVKDIVTEHPSFARAIQKRCLGSAGRLALPVTFMSKYLVGSEGLVVLEDEGGMLWKVYWIAYMQSGRRLAFTRGWPAFVSHHDGKDGDIFIAEIVAPDHLRVQVISSNFNHGRQSHCGGAFSPKDPAPVNETASEDFKRNLQHFADGKEQVSNDSPLSFLLQESKILRRKRSKMMSRAVGLHDSIGRPLESTSHADKLLDTCTVHACKPRSSVQACQLSSSMESVLFSKNDMNENLRTKCHEKYIKETFYRKSADVQPRTRSHKLLSNVAGSTTTIYDKKRKYGAQFCQYTKDSCNLYVLHGFKFCMLHILEDCSAPYKQCDFIEKQIRVRCGFPVCLNLSDPRFCQIHRQSDNLVGEIELGSSFLNVVPAFGKFSSIMMAVTVSHHLSEKTDLWICSKSNCLPNADIFWDQQYEKPGAGWAKLFTRRISDLHHDVIEESNDSTSQEVTLVSMKANLENISRYVGWRSSVSLNSEGRTNSCLYNTGDFLDGEEEKELQTNTNNFVQKNVSQSEYKISLRFETDVEEHDSSAVQPQARRACCSKFVGVRKRPWGAYGAEICTSEGKRLWLGTFSTEKEGALAYDDAARVLRSNGAVTNFSKGQNLVRGERSDRSTEAPEQRSVLRKRGRSVGTKKYYDAYPVETSEKLLDLTHSFLDGSIEDHNLIQSRVNLLGDGIFSPGFKQGVQSLPTMKTERDFFKLEKCELPEAKQDLCLEHLNEQQISESHWSSSPCLPMETENADQHNLESSMSCLKQSILHGSCDNGKKLNGTKSLSFCQPGDRGEVHSDDSDILFTPCESKVMKELQKNFMELKEEFGSEMTHAVESEVSDITQLNGSTSFVPEGNMTIIGGFPNCNTRRNSVSPGKFQILSELNVEEKTVLSLGFCLKL